MDKLSLILSGAAVLLNLVVLLVLLFRGRERRDALTYDQLRRELAEQNRLTAQQVRKSAMTTCGNTCWDRSWIPPSKTPAKSSVPTSIR